MNWYVYFVAYAFISAYSVATKNPCNDTSQNIYVTISEAQNVIHKEQPSGGLSSIVCIRPLVMISATILAIDCGARNISQISTIIRLIKINIFTIYNII